MLCATRYGVVQRGCEEAYFVVGFDVEFDLLAGEGSHSIVFVSLIVLLFPPLPLPGPPPERT